MPDRTQDIAALLAAREQLGIRDVSKDPNQLHTPISQYDQNFIIPDQDPNEALKEFNFNTVRTAKEKAELRKKKRKKSNF